MKRLYQASFIPKQQGASLIEMLVGLVAGLILMASLITVSALAINYSSDSLKRDKLNIELQHAMEIMTGDIRRAGYWAQANNNLNTGANSNPFMASANDISINSSNDCILISYDRDKNGAANNAGNANTNEHFGYRLTNGVIQALTNDVDNNCTSTASSWENLTDASIVTITQLAFNLSNNSNLVIDIDGAGAGTSTINIRYLTVTITGRLVSDSTITKTLTEKVRIRNDRYSP